jgi:NADH-quinone oxidoreductase subunit B
VTDGPVDLALPAVGRPGPPPPVRVRLSDGTRDYSLWVLNVGLACCSVEFVAAALGASQVAETLDLGQAGDGVDVLVVSGTCTDAMAPALLRLYESLPEPRRVVSFGACASSGGPYWDSYSVTPGIDTFVPVDLYVPGCPPRPEAIIEALGLLLDAEGAA